MITIAALSCGIHRSHLISLGFYMEHSGVALYIKGIISPCLSQDIPATKTSLFYFSELQLCKFKRIYQSLYSKVIPLPVMSSNVSIFEGGPFTLIETPQHQMGRVKMHPSIFLINSLLTSTLSHID